MVRLKTSLFIIFLVALFPIMANSAPLADCELTTVQAAVTASTSGDTIELPVCSGVTWASALNIPSSKKIILKGQGMGSTIISRNGTAVTMNESGSRITGVGFTLDSVDSAQINVQGSGWRIDHCRFTNNSGLSRISILVNSTDVSLLPSGVIDNNDFVQGRIVVWMGSNITEHRTIWSTPHLFGANDTNGDKAVYIEDNTFYKTVSGGGNVIDSNLSSSYVARYNTVTGVTQFQAHSLQDATRRGSYTWEVYGNNFSASSSVFTWLYFRAGTGYIFGNKISGSYSYGPVFDNWRCGTAVSGTSSTGLCDGGTGSYGQWDGSSVNGWPCRDQIGRGPDSSLWTEVSPYPVQTSQPTYLWSNLRSGVSEAVTIQSDSADWIQANRDYYTQGASFNGTSGVGCGTLANRPATCTSGVAYWATTQSCTDLTGMVGANPSTPISGTLYICGETGWTDGSTYTPYTYPHPLRVQKFHGNVMIGGAGLFN